MNVSDRAKNIMLFPQSTWIAIEAEQMSIGEINRHYVMPLAAIPAVATVIGDTLFGGSTFVDDFAFGILDGLLAFLFVLVVTSIVAVIIDWTAPNFGGNKNRLNSYKLAAYSLTPAWLAGVFNIVPALSRLTILGIYGAYLLYLGIPILMKSPADRAVPYMATIALVAVALLIAVSLMVPKLFLLFGSYVK